MLVFSEILDLGFGGCIFSVWDVYWCNQNQAWTFRAGSRTPSLDSKMCKFPRISPSELWKVRNFRLILDSGFAGQLFLCRIPVNKGPKMKFLSWTLDADFDGNFFQKQAWHHLPGPKFDSLSQNLPLETAWTRTSERNSTKRRRWTLLSEVLKWCQIRVNGQNHNFLKWLALHTWMIFWYFFSLPCAASEVFCSFLFLRNTFQFSGVHSKCDVRRATHHSEMGKTLQSKCFKRKTLKCPQSLRERCAIKIACTCLYKSCQKRRFSGTFWIWVLMAAVFPFEMFTTGALKFKHQISWVSLSELWKVRSFMLILESRFAGQPFSCRIPDNNHPKMKLLSRKLDSGFGGNFCQEQTQAWHHLFRPKPDSLSHFFLLMINIMWWFLLHFPLPGLGIPWHPDPFGPQFLGKIMEI